MKKGIGKHLYTFRTFVLKENSGSEDSFGQCQNCPSGISKHYQEILDEILDLYNEVGEENMEKDEVDFLKKCGRAQIPKRIVNRTLQKLHDDSIENKNLGIINITTKEWQDIYDLKKIISNPQDVKVTFDYNNVGFGLDVMCNLNFIFTQDTFDSLKKLNTQFYLKKENDKIIYSIPKSWLDHIPWSL
jgi:hypothetical protein